MSLVYIWLVSGNGNVFSIFPGFTGGGPLFKGGYVSNSPFSGPMWPRGGSVRYIFTFFSFQAMYNLSINIFERHC